MTPPTKRPRLTWHPDVPRTAEEAEKQLENALKASMQRIACPVCGETWPESEIARHASSCGVTTNKDATVQQWAAIFPPIKKPQRIPSYKILDGMPIAVDAFRYGAIEGCTAYFLSHFHSDHYAGLSKRWAHGPIYCTRETERLVHATLHVDRAWLRILDLDIRTQIPEAKGVHVTCLPANHCPGSCLFLFEGPRKDGRMVRYLHCGDFRACPAHTTHMALKNACPLDAIYLDTTYLNPQYCFPPQPQVMKACTDLVMSKTSPLVVVGTYTIGKERLFLALAEAMDTSVYCVDKRKYDTYALLDDAVLQKRLTKNPLQARVHVMPLRSLVPDALQTYASALQKQGLTIAHTLAFRPTGWTSRQPRRQIPPPRALSPDDMVPPPFTHQHLQPVRHGSVHIYAVPYSEHSSFYELMAFMLHIPHHRMIPTVPTKFQRYANVWTEASQHHGHVLIKPRSTDYW